MATTSQHIPGIPVTGPIDIVGGRGQHDRRHRRGPLPRATPAQAAHLGCLVASITIQQLGVTGTATPEQVLERFRMTCR